MVKHKKGSESEPSEPLSWSTAEDGSPLIPVLLILRLSFPCKAGGRHHHPAHHCLMPTLSGEIFRLPVLLARAGLLLRTLPIRGQARIAQSLSEAIPPDAQGEGAALSWRETSPVEKKIKKHG